MRGFYKGIKLTKENNSNKKDYINNNYDSYAHIVPKKRSYSSASMLNFNVLTFSCIVFLQP